METIHNALIKLCPIAERVYKNKYYRATQDTFFTLINVVVIASVLGLTADLFSFLNIWAEATDIIMSVVAIIFSCLGVLCALILPHYLAKYLNEDKELYAQLDTGILTTTTGICFFILTNQLTGLWEISSYGVEQITLAILTAFAVGGIYNAIEEHLTIIKEDEHVAPSIPNMHGLYNRYIKEIIVVLTCIVLSIVINLICLNTLNITFATFLLSIIIPIFNAFNSVWGLVLLTGILAMVWYSGFELESTLDPFIMGAALYFTVQNFVFYHTGLTPTGLLTPTTRFFIIALGGSSATLAPCILFKYFSKNDALRHLGNYSMPCVRNNDNFPYLYSDMIRNKTLMVPSIVVPMINVLLYVVFVQVTGMGGFPYVLPWMIPAPIAIIICSALNPYSILLALLLIVVDMLIYYPFCKKLEKTYEG